MTMGRPTGQTPPTDPGPGEGLTRRSRETADDLAAETRETPETPAETTQDPAPEVTTGAKAGEDPAAS